MEKQVSIYTKILEEANAEEEEKKAYSWFRERALEVQKKEVDQNVILSERDKIYGGIRTTRLLGRLFMFNYFPQTRNKMKYYDLYPVIFPMTIHDGGFTGINLHYLDPVYRARLMDSLYLLRNKTDMTDPNTRLTKLNYDRLETRREFKLAYPCIKRYITKRIRGPMAIIPPEEWELALFLPTHFFRKKSETTVWRDSKKIIREKLRKK